MGLSNPASSPPETNFTTRETPVYQDGFFARTLIWLLSRKMARALGKGTALKGYDGFVDLSKKITKGRNAQEQQALVAIVLKSVVPKPVRGLIRTVFSPTRLVCELNAWFAARLFEWLVGPCEVATAEVPGEGTQRTQRSGVHIERCRYLEQSRCVGMCINMCKLPTQDFFTQELGIPLTMTPNFEDFSCEMVFGQPPPPLETEDAYHQPCLAQQCDLATPNVSVCPRVR